MLEAAQNKFFKPCKLHRKRRVARHELTPLEKWANRSYFGKGNRGPKFHSGKEELAQFEEALAPPKPEAAAAPAPPAPYPTPAYDPRQRPPGQRSSS